MKSTQSLSLQCIYVQLGALGAVLLACTRLGRFKWSNSHCGAVGTAHLRT